MSKNWYLISLFAIAAAIGVTRVYAAPPTYCEVAQVAGSAKVVRLGKDAAAITQGMMLLKGDRIVVEKGGSVVVAFDPEWKNTTRLSENTHAIIRYINPVRIEIGSGDVYSKLDALPKGSTFEVVTPTAIAAARGTKYRVSYSNGETTIFNDSETSEVFCYHVDENGNRAGRVIILKPGQSVTIKGDYRVFDDLEEFLNARDNEDENRLNEDLRERSLSGEQNTGDGGGGYGD
jgi:hypothetical protein